MPSGGKRAGAGRKPGDGWRAPKPQTMREAATQVRKRIYRDGADPLSLACEIAQDGDNELPVRLEAIRIALPYLYPRLSAVVTATVDPPGGGAGGVSAASLARRLNDKLAALLSPGAVLEGVAEPTSAHSAREMADIRASSDDIASSPQPNTQPEAQAAP